MAEYMANPFVQYLQDTRGELRHVAWPTRMQTIVYAVLVAMISIGIAFYLGFFDFFFTSALGRVLTALPQHVPATQEQSSTSPISVTKQSGTTTTIPVGPAATPAKLPSL